MLVTSRGCSPNVSVLIETPARPRFVIKTSSTLGRNMSCRCYMLEELSNGGHNNDQAKRSTS